MANPVLTQSTIDQATELLNEVGANGGYIGVAQKIGLDKITKAQVEEIYEGMRNEIEALAASRNALLSS